MEGPLFLPAARTRSLCNGLDMNGSTSKLTSSRELEMRLSHLSVVHVTRFEGSL
jgi:hypothetical protein